MVSVSMVELFIFLFGVIFHKFCFYTGKFLILLFTFNQIKLDYTDRNTRIFVGVIGGVFYFILLIYITLNRY